MRLAALLLGACLAAPLAAQTVQPKFGAQQPEPKAEKSRKHAEKKPVKKAEPRAGMVQKGPDHAKFGSTVDQTEIDRKKKAEKKP